MKPRRIRIRLTLRGLMLLVLVLAAWLGWRVSKAREQTEAVASIDSLGGYVHYDWEFDGGKPSPGRSPRAPGWLRRAIGDAYFQELIGVNFAYGSTAGERIRHDADHVATEADVIAVVQAFPRLKYLFVEKGQATDRALEAVIGLEGLETLILWDATVTDAGLARLKELKSLKALHITNAGLGDGCIRDLKALPRLEALALQGNAITDRGLAELSDLTKLRELAIDLSSGDITDAGMASIKGLKQLEKLLIQRTKVTDKGLTELEGLTELKELWVSGSPVTPSGIKRLQSAIPSLKTIR